ncbi:hypothetical protein QU481_02145 [Crenobacter sp. SG2303]|uniref:Amino acid permease/ SLC12A domain-containing protein n=1 Tax=Crenobacter oryzisoli TaxID=3056844 RepID=A0ABT7XIT1_9NEIS|nr:hypothetical protein [Crenobacter sp. SG2303]MDN0073694.1 hypothetical protein [Crenobacter sp. SG2303]
MTTNSAGSLKLPALAALVVGSMIGGGIFSLLQNIAHSAGAGATLIGWSISAVGMFRHRGRQGVFLARDASRRRGLGFLITPADGGVGAVAGGAAVSLWGLWSRKLTL